MQTPSISIVIVDDHPVITHGLTNIFGKEKNFSVLGEAKDGKEALSVITKTQPDIIILDISLGETDGIDLLESFLEASPLSRIIMYTMHFNKNLVAWSLQAGAKGYMLKSDKTAELIQAARDVFQGKVHISSSIPEEVLLEIERGI